MKSRLMLTAIAIAWFGSAKAEDIKRTCEVKPEQPVPADVVVKGKSTTSKVTTDIVGQYTRIDVGAIDQDVFSGIVARRWCHETKSKHAWDLSVAGALDVVSEGDDLTAGRVAFGGLYWFSAHRDDPLGFSMEGDQAKSRRSRKRLGDGVVAQTGVGFNLVLGYEDYRTATYNSTTNSFRFGRDQRLASMVEVVAVYSRLNSGETVKFPPSTGWLTVEGRAAWVDKRAPSDSAPSYVNEAYAQASADLALNQFLNHAPFGSMLEYRVGYQHIFSERALVRDIGRVRLQWRPQRQHSLGGPPDALAIGLNYSHGNADFDALTLELAKSF